MKKAIHAATSGFFDHAADDDEQEGAQKSQPGLQAEEVVSCGGADGVGGVASPMSEEDAAHSMLGPQMADDRLDGGAASQLAFDRFRDAAPLRPEINTVNLCVGGALWPR